MQRNDFGSLLVFFYSAAAVAIDIVCCGDAFSCKHRRDTKREKVINKNLRLKYFFPACSLSAVLCKRRSSLCEVLTNLSSPVSCSCYRYVMDFLLLKKKFLWLRVFHVLPPLFALFGSTERWTLSSAAHFFCCAEKILKHNLMNNNFELLWVSYI